MAAAAKAKEVDTGDSDNEQEVSTVMVCGVWTLCFQDHTHRLVSSTSITHFR